MFKIVRSSNGVVTNYYLDVIGRLLEICGVKKIGEEVPLKEYKKKCVLITPSSVDFVRLFFKGFRNQIYWMQGIDAEESYMKHGSRIRRFVLDAITKFSLKKCLGVFFVSKEMKRYEEQKFHITTEEKSFIMPCFNVTQTETLKLSNEKYRKNIFAYVGSLSKWQCFEETLRFYKAIEETDSSAELRIFTFEKEKANELVSNMNIKRCKVDSVPPDMMEKALEDVKFGFVLRKDDPVNRVATPTKISTYLSAGVIPVFSVFLNDFFEKTQDYKFVVPIVDFEPSRKLYELMHEDIDINELIEEYMGLFHSYYNPDHYVEKYKRKMKKILE